MKISGLVFLTGLVVLFSGAPVSGQVTRTVERQTSFADLSTTDAMGNLLVTGDLLTAASPDVTFPFSQNNDQLASAPGVGVGDNDGEAVVAGTGGPFTFTFLTPVEITQIDVYTAWRDARAGQNLEISLSTDGVNFVPLIDYDEPSVGGEVVLSSITDAAGVPLGSDVTAIRFTLPEATNGSGAVFREIDVIGTADPIAEDQVIFSVERQVSYADLSTTDAMGNLLETGDLLTIAVPDVEFPAFQNNDLLSDDPSTIAPGPADGVVDSEAVVAGEGGPFTYTFPTTVEITQINVYSAWRDARAGQNLSISVSTDGENFEPLITYNVESPGDEVVLSTITVANGDPLGTDITAIRFTPGSGTNGTGGVFREIDVIGTSGGFLPGDVNRDGEVNFLDIVPFIGVLSGSLELRLEADTSLDGEVDFLDIVPFITLLSS